MTSKIIARIVLGMMKHDNDGEEITAMTTREFQDGSVHVTEKLMSYAECEQIYGTSNVQVLNMRFTEAAQRATDGNCDQWAMYGNGGITVVTEC